MACLDDTAIGTCAKDLLRDNFFARIMYNKILYAVSNMKWEDEEPLQPLQELTSVSNNNYTNQN